MLIIDDKGSKKFKNNNRWIENTPLASFSFDQYRELYLPTPPRNPVSETTEALPQVIPIRL
jgi:hypothetical protein